MRSRIRPFIILVVGILAVSAASTLIRFAQQAGAASIVIASYRMTIAAVGVMLISLCKRSWRTVEAISTNLVLLMTLSGLFLAIHFASWITSLELTSVTNSVVLVTTTPIWVALLSPFVLRENVHPFMWGAIIVVIVGGVIISQTGRTAVEGTATLLGDALALLGALAGAGYFMIGRVVRNEVSLLLYLTVVYSSAAALLIVTSAVFGTPATVIPITVLPWLLAVGIVPQLIGHSAINEAMRHISASFVAVSIIGEAVFSILLAIIFLAESPTTSQLVGAATVIAGITVAFFIDRLVRRQVSNAIAKMDGTV